MSTELNSGRSLGPAGGLGAGRRSGGSGGSAPRVSTATDGTFAAAVLDNPRPVLVEFWAEWCPPCRQLAPILEALAADLAGQVDVVKVNIDENPQTTARYGIMLAPTMNLYRGGEVVRQLVGARSKSALLRDFGLAQ